MERVTTTVLLTCRPRSLLQLLVLSLVVLGSGIAYLVCTERSYSERIVDITSLADIMSMKSALAAGNGADERLVAQNSRITKRDLDSEELSIEGPTDQEDYETFTDSAESRQSDGYDGIDDTFQEPPDCDLVLSSYEERLRPLDQGKRTLTGSAVSLDMLPPGFMLHPKKVRDRLRKGSLHVPCQEYLEDLYIHFAVVRDVTNITAGRAFGGDQVTFVTQLTAQRMDKLEMILHHWSGPVSASLFVNTTEAEYVIRTMCTNPAFVSRWHNLAIHFVMRHCLEDRQEMYPINHLRNVALEAARSTYVFLSDVDFAPHAASHDTVRRHCANMEDELKQKTLLVVPAFEYLEDLSAPDKSLPRSKRELMEMEVLGDLQAFHIKVFPRGHGPTRFDIWWDTELPYEIEWSQYFEPYVVVRRDLAPLYPRELLSRQLNKVAHIFLLHHMGFRFKVLPDVYTIHVPHPSDREVKLWYSCVMNIYAFLTQEMAKKSIHLAHLKDIDESVITT